jgi:nicotinate-nucleotide pyrophosphorylase (carboxylating)
LLTADSFPLIADSSMTPIRFGPDEISACIRLAQVALGEDLGRAGDITSRALVPDTQQGTAVFVARQPGVVAGLEAARILLSRVDISVTWEWNSRDGVSVEPGTILARTSGRLRSLLAAERVSLNLLQHLSGVATLTNRFVSAVAGLNCKIYDTRKTTPGLRVLEKYAVRAGGGHNHRMGLHDAVLIKDNHLVAWRMQNGHPSVADAVRAARKETPPGTLVELEVDSVAQLEEALPASPDIALLDNMSAESMRAAVALRDQRAPGIILEASGGIALDTVRAVAETGVDRISVGALTHSAPALDIALDFQEPAA